MCIRDRFSDAQGEAIREAGRSIPIVWADNFSVGVTVLGRLAAEAARMLGGGFDMEIVETHHPVSYTHLDVYKRQGGACAGTAISHRKASVQYAECRLFSGVEAGERYIQEAMTLMLPADVQVKMCIRDRFRASTSRRWPAR